MKKRIKSTICFILTAALLVGCMSNVLAGAGSSDLTKKSSIQLQFRPNGKFRILQFADTQDSIFCRPGTIELIKTAIAKYDPDLVVFTGDNTRAVQTKLECKYALKAILTPVEEAQIPFTCVLGNHDAEKVPQETHLGYWRDYSMCLAYDDDPDIYGVGTHNLTVLSSNGNKAAFNIWMFDSNMYDEVNGGYDYVHEDQIEWYRNRSDELKAANGGQPVPSMCFQHIVMNEIMDYVIDSDEEDGFGYQDGDKYKILDPQYAEPGSYLLEHPCPGTVDSQQYEAFAEQGDVCAVITGHDHVNDFVVHTASRNAGGNTIDLINTPTAGFSSYGNEINRGVRVIDIDENDPWNYTTFSPTFFEALGDTDDIHALSYFSKDGATFWYIGMVIYMVPLVGPTLQKGFLKGVWSIVKKVR